MQLSEVSRVVQRELLDELPFDDPEGMRSRRDLGRINWLMGNHRWLRAQLRGGPARRTVELGASGGDLLCSLQGEDLELVGLDLAPRPEDLPAEIEWAQGDVQETLQRILHGGEVVVVNHLLHQFEDDVLKRLGEVLQHARMILASEPLRSLRARCGLRVLSPIVNRVTLHDGLVSIRAGFRKGELPALLGLPPDQWCLTESTTAFGAYRLKAERIAD